MYMDVWNISPDFDRLFIVGGMKNIAVSILYLAAENNVITIS